MKPEIIAKVAHEVNRAYCIAIGQEDVSPEWDEFGGKDGIISGAQYHLDYPDVTPEESHAAWLAEKEKLGWRYGEEKDDKEKTHPCMVPYEELPVEDRVKDYLFAEIVSQLAQIEPEVVEVEAPALIEMVPIKYIGKREYHTDNLYGTGVTWASGETRLIPVDKVAALLQHADVYERDGESVIKDATPSEDPEQEDDPDQEYNQHVNNIGILTKKAEVISFMKDMFPDYDPSADLKATAKTNGHREPTVADHQEVAVRMLDQLGA